jgi:hypothetical protein
VRHFEKRFVKKPLTVCPNPRKRHMQALVCVFPLSLLAVGFALAADDSKVNAATNQVESGYGKIAEGVGETAKGVGKTASDGAKYSAEKVKEAGQAAEPSAKTAWGNARDGASSKFLSSERLTPVGRPPESSGSHPAGLLDLGPSILLDEHPMVRTSDVD